MQGITITTNLAANQTIDLARQAAAEMTFGIQPVTPDEFVASMGSLGRSVLLGPFVAYCRFRISVVEFDNAEVDLILQRNFPWWAGFSGVAKARGWAVKLAMLIARRIEEQGGKVKDCREYW